MQKLALLDRLSYHYLPNNLIVSSVLLHFIFAAQAHIMTCISKGLSPSSDFIV